MIQYVNSMAQNFYTSSIGKKVLMAVTGFSLGGFLVVHLGGNLTLYAGAGVFNSYARHLQSLGPFLWVPRILLLILILGHIHMGVSLALANSRARPEGYRGKKEGVATLPARTMIVSGSIILAFIIYHLLHFTDRKSVV